VLGVNRKCLEAVVLLGVLSAPLLSSYKVDAVPIPPCSFSGYVYTNGAPAPDGTSVRGSIDGVFYGVAETFSNGRYSLVVNGDDDSTSIKEGGVPPDLVAFWVEIEIADEYAYFIAGGNEILDLNVQTLAQPALLKINEVMPAPSSGSEWVELYNPTSSTVPLDYYSISDNDGYRGYLSGHTIPADGFFVFSYPAFPSRLVDSGDEIKLDWYNLANEQFFTIDRLEFGSADDETILSNAPAPDPDKSLALQPDGDDHGDPANDFTILDSPTPGSTNGSPPPIPGDINEDGTVDVLDLIELRNAYGSTQQSPNWDPDCDLNLDDVVSVPDMLILGKNYGRMA